MPIAEATSAYRLEDRASPTLAAIRREGQRTTLALKGTATALDKIGAPAQIQRLDRLDGRLEKIGSQAERTAGRVGTSMGRMEDRIRFTTIRSEQRLDSLLMKLYEVGMAQPSPTVNVDGIAAARAELALLSRELNAFDRRSATARVGVTRPLTGSTAGGGRVAPAAARAGVPSRPRVPAGGGDQGGGLRSVGVGPFSLGPRAGLALMAGSVPLARGLVGGAGALTATVGGAALGAGAVGLGAGLGTGVAGAGALASVLVPLKDRLKEAQKAQEKVTSEQQNYNRAVRDYGYASTQAVAAERRLADARRERNAATPPGATQFMQQRADLSRDWRRATAPGQQALLGLGTRTLGNLRQASPELGQQANTVSIAAAAAGGDFADFLTMPAQLAAMRDLTGGFASNLDEAEGIAENLYTTFTNIARASMPYFNEGTQFVETWTDGWARSTSDIDRTSSRIGSYVNDFRELSRLAGAAWRLTRDLLGPGRVEGRSMVSDLTDTLNRWDRWAQTNPRQIQGFFHDGVESTEQIATFLGEVVKELERAGELLSPFANTFLQLANMAGGAGLLLPSLLRYGVGRAVSGPGGAAGAGMVPMPIGGGAGSNAPLAVAAGTGYAALRGATGSAAATSRLGAAYAQRFPATSGTLGLFNARMNGPAIVPSGAPVGGVAGGARLGAPTSVAGARAYGLGRAVAPVGRFARGAGRFAAPVSIAMGAIDALTFQGDASGLGSLGGRTQAALSGATFGIVPRPTSSADRDQQVNEYISGVTGQLSDGKSRRDVRGDIERLQLGIQTMEGNDGLDLGEGDDRARRVGQIRDAFEDEIKMRREGLRAWRQQLRDDARTRSQQRGIRLTGSLQSAYGVGVRGGLSREDSFGQVADMTLNKMKGMRPAGARILADNMLAWAREMEKRNPELAGTVDALTKRIEKRFDRMGRHVKVVNDSIYTGTSAEWQKIATAMTDPAERMQERLSAAFTAVQRQAVGSLQAMGFTKADAQKLVQGMESGGVRGRVARERAELGPAEPSRMAEAMGAPTRRARGGIIPGHGLADRVPFGGAMTAPGEGWIANRHHMAQLDAMLAPYGTTFRSVVERDDTPHGAPLRRYDRGGKRPRRARGGSIVPVPGFPGEQAASSILDEIAFYTRRYGLTLTDAYGQGHQSPGHTTYGTAADLAGPDASMDRAVRAMVKRGYKVLYDGRFGSTAWPGHGPSSVAGGNAHIHVEFGSKPGRMRGAGPMMGGGDQGGPPARVNFNAPRSGMTGIPGAMADRAGAMYAAGAQKKINAALRRMGATAGGGGMGRLGSLKGDVLSFSQVARLAESVGLPGVTFAQIAKGESGFRPGAIGHDPGGTTGLGLWQITTGFNDDVIARFGGRNAMLRPRPNAMAAKTIYDRQGIGAWYGTRYMTDPNAHYKRERGGRFAGWFGSGGRITARGRTLIGVGEEEAGVAGEDVTVTRRRGGPARHGGRGRAGVVVTIQRVEINYNRRGDLTRQLKAAVRDEIAQAFDELREELEEADDTDEALV